MNVVSKNYAEFQKIIKFVQNIAVKPLPYGFSRNDILTIDGVRLILMDWWIVLTEYQKSCKTSYNQESKECQSWMIMYI